MSSSDIFNHPEKYNMPQRYDALVTYEDSVIFVEVDEMKLLLFPIILILAFTIFPNTSIANDNIDSIVANDFSQTIINWNISGSPYIIDDNITVDENTTLTIDPGVTIQFNLSICNFSD